MIIGFNIIENSILNNFVQNMVLLIFFSPGQSVPGSPGYVFAQDALF